MSYHHLNTFKRTRIEVLSKTGSSTRQIAGQLNRHQQAITCELKPIHTTFYQIGWQRN
ncbi:helix-turn-helix domain-containing protein [Turicibacter bilis]|uniref:Helix-turn-helix domain-containing protein n=1 Tax=Turicibacter bilis TaxID=2735723 RepID=A0A9Q9CFK3_9FIRM|nr:helix-turn-helix domain-containing protein [Turicibacter bilis]MBS3199166.1 helix-turn-helix domain-containing protein [Turicibacter bilis]UUF07653.1 helix-turn-helix domain-containing protein [Turicibacter bilis]